MVQARTGFSDSNIGPTIALAVWGRWPCIGARIDHRVFTPREPMAKHVFTPPGILLGYTPGFPASIVSIQPVLPTTTARQSRDHTR